MGKDGFGRYPVQDVMMLRALVKQMVEHYGQGSVNKAAAAIGLSQPTLYRLHEGLSGQVSHATMVQLERAVVKLDHRLRKQLLLAIMPTAALRLYRRGYSAWCRERSLRLVRRRGQAWWREQDKPPRPVREPWRVNNINADLSSAYSQARQEFPDLFERLHRFVVRKGIPPERYKVAVTRIVEPVAESSASAYFEPRWMDLTPDQRRRFIKAGITREEILMSREHPQILANVLAAGGDPGKDKIQKLVRSQLTSAS